MRIGYLGIAAIVAATAFAGVPTAVVPVLADEAGPNDCGWLNENGRLVFLGTCPHETSQDDNAPLPPTITDPCGGPTPGYRIRIAGC